MMWLLLLLLVLILYNSGIFDNMGGQSNSHQQANARNLLDERYARGELTTDEYDTMRNNLTH